MTSSSVLVDIDGVVTAKQLTATAEAIADWQLNNGMVPWSPGAHADPWNHTEALMALMLGGQREAAERGFDWLRSKQHEDGAWHQYYTADGVEEDKLDANCIAYVATGAWFHWLTYRDRGVLEELWPMVRDATDFVIALQQPRGEIIWARHADSTPFTFALLTGSSSICHSLRCSLAIARELGHERPNWEQAIERLYLTIRDEPNAFAPKHRWAMDWYYPVMCGVMIGESGRTRLQNRFEAFSIPEWGIRCVSDRPWITAAESCECAIAHLVVGERDRALELFSWAQRLRTDDNDRYWTGIVIPEEVHFPGGEQSTYTAAAVLLAADALGGESATAPLFTDPKALPLPGIEL